ncbi:helix-turn-helix domain-containing protein [Paenibacillus brevis]|uniref:Helix-turn-helix domain-containing protein n=1 Tax=Paenibacillus brevis TaxID=2841508 RepID=A0ABS6FNH9_9BACL|nr:helix-turn-helix domain-containing protein [Paenibacillus brevis]MBU5670993.1 helix-turn-helix domain-containing protein [Paenibacillus brevis]
MNEQQKYQILLHGITGNNVSRTCREFGISRTLYYRWYKAYAEQGMEGLAEAPRRPVMPNQVDRRTEKAILAHVARHPQDGPKRISYELENEGIIVGETGIYNVLRRQGLNCRSERERFAREIKEHRKKGRRSEAKASRTEAAGRNVPRQKKLDYKLKLQEHARPGYICYQAIQYLGKLPGAGKVYQYIVLDSYSRLAIMKLYPRRSADDLMDFMKMRIIPLLKTFDLSIDHLVTNSGQEFATSWERGNHKYTNYLHKLGITQEVFAAGRQDVFQPLHEFTALLAREFYKPQISRLASEEEAVSLDRLEQRLNEYLNFYNYNRPLDQGANRGRIPTDIVLGFRDASEPLPLWLFTRR